MRKLHYFNADLRPVDNFFNPAVSLLILTHHYLSFLRTSSICFFFAPLPVPFRAFPNGVMYTPHTVFLHPLIVFEFIPVFFNFFPCEGLPCIFLPKSDALPPSREGIFIGGGRDTVEIYRCFTSDPIFLRVCNDDDLFYNNFI